MRKATARPAGERLIAQHAPKRLSWEAVYSEMRRLRRPLKERSNSYLGVSIIRVRAKRPVPTMPS